MRWIYSRGSDIRAVARGCGGRYDEEHHVLGRTIAKAMFSGRRNVGSLSRTEGYCVARKFESRSAGEHVEELARARMEMPHFAGTRRYTLLDDAKICTFQKMPTVANGSPGVVLGALPINRHRFDLHVRFSLQWRHRPVHFPAVLTQDHSGAKRRQGSNRVTLNWHCSVVNAHSVLHHGNSKQILRVGKS